MNKQSLISALEEALNTGDRTDEEKIFIKLLQQVWEIDWTVAPYDVWTHMIECDVPYFLRFMAMDEGDEEVEDQLVQEWIASRLALRSKTGKDWKRRIVDLIDEMNQVRASIRKESR